MADFEQPKNTIKVEFINNVTLEPFAVSEVPVENLPDTFEIATNLEIARQQWSVSQAIPARKEEFIKTGNLKVFLDKVQMINPEEILFSIPTINNSIFEIELAADNSEIFRIHEDDWRQMEFISGKYRLEIAQEISSINQIYETHKIGAGFDQIHIRKLVEQPLDDKNINLTALMQDVGVVKIYDGFGVKNYKAKNSFAFQATEKTIFYGQAEDNQIKVLCTNNSENLAEIIKKILRKYELIFGDWCGMKIME